MAIPGPGVPISMTTLNTEFGGGFSLSSYYRGGSFVPNTPQNAAVPTSGAISLGNFYGAVNRIIISLTATGNNYDVYANRGPTYSPGISDLTITVPGTVGSASTGSYAMLVPNAFNPTDTVTIVNNGVIQGMGGAGGGGAAAVLIPTPLPAGSPGGGGGNAIYINRPTTITNNGTIAAGGGGGGGGGAARAVSKGIHNLAGGGGGGGGAGTNGGGAGAGGTASTGPNVVRSSPGSPGGAGTSPAGGGGGARGTNPIVTGGNGGTGGGRGAGGAAGAAGTLPATVVSPGGAAGAAGSYLVGNPFVTWPATGTRQGNVS